MAKVSCILRHQGVQLILACSWARTAILVGGKGKGGMFLFLLFLHFHSCSSFYPDPLFHLLYYLFYLFSPFYWEKRGGRVWRRCSVSRHQGVQLIFCSYFFHIPLFHLLYYLSAPFLLETTQNDPQRLTVVKPKHNQSIMFNDTSTLVDHFVSPPRESVKMDRRVSRRQENEK